MFDRYVNDAPQKFSNAVMKRHVIKDNVFLALFAIRQIKSGTEIRYV